MKDKLMDVLAGVIVFVLIMAVLQGLIVMGTGFVDFLKIILNQVLTFNTQIGKISTTNKIKGGVRNELTKSKVSNT